MTLRARLALALAVLAGASVVVVAVVSYVATDHRLHDDVVALQLEGARHCVADGAVVLGEQQAVAQGPPS